MDVLPLELQVEILSHLPAPSLLQCARVCRTWHSLLSYERPAPHSPSSELSSFLIRSSSSSLEPIYLEEEAETEDEADAPWSVWTRRAQRMYAPWLDILNKATMIYRDCRWLCMACDRLITQDDIAAEYTGLGRIDNYQSSALAPLAPPGERVVGSVKYMHTYVGEWRNGQFHGLGLLRPAAIVHQPPTGATSVDPTPWFDHFVGHWKGGKQHGKGHCSWKQGGASFTGAYRRGYRHGKGVYHWANGSRYRGHFKRNDIWGRGTYTWSKGYIRGHWKMNKQHGHCRIVWNTGCSFQGTYRYGVRTGNGTYCWTDGGVYVGEWRGVHREGRAVMTFANGMVFDGMYKDDERHGLGTLRWPNGDTYEGRWVMGKRHGTGTFTEAATGRTQTQEWREGNACYSRHAPRYPNVAIKE